jgi:hypothetical protein
MGRESRDDRDADESLRRWMRGTGGGDMATTDFALHGLAVWAHAWMRFHEVSRSSRCRVDAR